MKTAASIKSTVNSEGINYNGIVTEVGFKYLLSSFAELRSNKVTNILLLNNFSLPVGKQLKDLTFEDVKSFIAYQSFVGNSGVINEDGSQDMRVYLSTNGVYEMTMIATIPEEKGVGSNYNAAILLMGGNEQESVSLGSDIYVPTGSEVLFSISTFDVLIKSEENPFSLVWYLRLS